MADVQDTNSEPRALDLDDAADAILNRWSDGESPSEVDDEDATSDNDESIDEQETVDDDEVDPDANDTEDADDDGDTEDDQEDPDEEGDDEDTDDDDEEADDDDDTEEDNEPQVLSDDAVLEVMVDGKPQQVSAKDLKRLYGQEQSLTRKSQEVAATRKQAEESLAKADISYRKLIERAEARHKPYAEVDMLVASRQMDPEEFGRLRQEAKEAEADLKFLKEEANAFYAEVQNNMKKQQQEAAAECVKVLQEQMPDWGNDLYDNIRSYAVKSGLPAEQVDQYVDPHVIMLINKARLYDESKLAASTKKAKATMSKKKKSGRKVLTSKKAPPSQADNLKSRQKKAQDRIRTNASRAGDLDDIAEALLARWEQ